MPRRMDSEGAASLLLGDHGAGQDTLLEIGPGPLTPDLTDDAGADVGAPSALLHLIDHLLGEAVDAAVVIGRVLVIVDVVAAAHDDVSAGFTRDLGEPLGIRLQAADRQFHDGLAASSTAVSAPESAPMQNVLLFVATVLIWGTTWLAITWQLQAGAGAGFCVLPLRQRGGHSAARARGAASPSGAELAESALHPGAGSMPVLLQLPVLLQCGSLPALRPRCLGSRSGCASNQACRLRATSGRSCSAACAGFF